MQNPKALRSKILEMMHSQDDELIALGGALALNESHRWMKAHVEWIHGAGYITYLRSMLMGETITLVGEKGGIKMLKVGKILFWDDGRT